MARHAANARSRSCHASVEHVSHSEALSTLACRVRRQISAVLTNWSCRNAETRPSMDSKRSVLGALSLRGSCVVRDGKRPP